jgi:ABC-type sugar transport system substrate-binding protein
MNHERTTSLKTTMTRPAPTRRRAASVAAMAAALAAIGISAGCDSSSFVSPPPSSGKRSLESGIAATFDGKAAGAATTSPAAAKPQPRHAGGTARVVELILARPANDDRVYLTQALRRELGKALIPLQVSVPDSPEKSSPEALAATIRAAADRGVAGLIVEPRDDPAVIDALYDALGRGCAVLLLDRPVPARGGKAIPRVEYTGLAEAGRQIVDDILEADRSFKRAHPGRVIILHHRSDDLYIDRCLASLLEPLRAAGRSPEVVAFEGDIDLAVAAVRKSMDADPTVDILLADDRDGVAASVNLRKEWIQAGRREFLLAGYSPYDHRTPDAFQRARSFADRSVETYATKTFQAIRSLIDGKPVGDVVAVPVTFHRQTTLFVPVTEPSASPAKKAAKP